LLAVRFAGNMVSTAGSVKCRSEKQAGKAHPEVEDCGKSIIFAGSLTGSKERAWKNGINSASGTSYWESGGF
jgi:hypothetical protein